MGTQSKSIFITITYFITSNTEPVFFTSENYNSHEICPRCRMIAVILSLAFTC